MKLRLMSLMVVSVWVVLLAGSLRGQGVDRAAELFEAGQNAHQSGDLSKAIDLYGQALAIDKDLWQAEYQRSLALMTLGRLGEARAGVLRVLSQLEGYRETGEGRQMLARATQSLGEILLGEGQAGEAEKRFREALKLDGKLWRSHAGLAESLLRSARHEEAAAAAMEAIRGGDGRSSTIGLLGVAQSGAGRVSEALQSFDEALRRESKNIVALRGRAEIRLLKQEFEAAAADLRQALAVAPDAGLHLRLGWTLSRMERNEEALAEYRAALAIDPGNNEAKVAVAALTIRSGSGSEAIGQLEALIATEPGRADLRAQLGELYLAGQPEKALEQYLAAVKLEPTKASHRIGLGSTLVRLRRMEQAVPLLRQALEMNPPADSVYYAHTNLGTALFELGDFAAAVPEFRWILEHQTDEKRRPITLYFLGICYDKQGEYEEALKIYDEFLLKAGTANQLEIEKVKLRMPSLRRQIREGQGKKKR